MNLMADYSNDAVETRSYDPLYSDYLSICWAR